MKKLLALVSLSLIVIFPPHAFADSNFSISMQTSYVVQENGITRIVQSDTIKNLKELVYTPSYTINLGIEHINNLQVTSGQGKLDYTISQTKSGNKIIEVNFQCKTDDNSANKCLGKNKLQKFTISLDTSDIATKRGDGWEINIPGITNPDQYKDLSTSISVPESFGNPSIMKPAYTRPLSNPLNFSKTELGKGGVYLLYGNHQVYSYNLNYHISNPNLFPIKTEVALPPPTNYQDVTLDSLNPAPSNVYKDADGNWLAEYNLGSSEKMDIAAKGQIEVNISPSQEELSNMDTYVNSLPYWEVSSSDIQKVAGTLQTPKDIYSYVVGHLTYNYKKTSAQDNRLGAKKTLQNPDDAVCLEFTDLFVALARAKGIPARAIEGYAYTTDQTLRPSSLVQDVLHAWPEYYDEQKKTWVMVDPTWGNTTGGMDYFNSLDYDHIAFAIKGLSSTYPIPAGGYKLKSNTKDVHISFSSDPSFQRKYSATLISVVPNHVFSLFPFSGKVTIKNTGNSSIENKSLHVDSAVPLAQSVFNIDYIPPFGSKTFDLRFSHPSLLTNRKFKVTMHFDGISDSKIIQVQVFPLYGIVLVGGGICAIIIISIIAFKSRRISL